MSSSLVQLCSGTGFIRHFSRNQFCCCDKRSDARIGSDLDLRWMRCRKQMAIDADLNAGLITQIALERRERVTRESDFMALWTSLKICPRRRHRWYFDPFINIIGGFAIGTLQHGLMLVRLHKTVLLLSAMDLLHHSIDAFIPLPIIVTRVSGEQDVSAEVARQLTQNPRVLYVAAGIIGVMGAFQECPTWYSCLSLHSWVFLVTSVLKYRSS